MKVKVFYPDKNGKISFTKEELQALLDEVYKEGYNDARPYYWTSPYWTWSNSNINTTTTPYITYNTRETTISNSTSANPENCPAYAGSTLTSATTSEAPDPEPYKIEFKSA